MHTNIEDLQKTIYVYLELWNWKSRGANFLPVSSPLSHTLCKLLRVSLVQLFVKVHNEKVEFQKAECLVKTIKKCIMKKLSVWLALIKVAVWEINYQKWQCIYKGIYFILFFMWVYFILKSITSSYLNQFFSF